MKNRNINYLETLNFNRSQSKFNMIYEAIMSDLDIYKNVPVAKTLNNPSLNLILEEIDKPQSIICESGRELLLEEAIFMDEDYLISEGILDKVGEKIQQLIEWIKKGIKEILKKSSEVIKAFIEKVKNNKVVVAIRKKLGLDEKLSNQKFKQFVKIKAGGKEVAVESVLANDCNIITEATKLSKTEEAITDPEQIKARIKKYEEAISGAKPLKNAKTGKPLTKKYMQEKLNLFKKKLNALNSGDSPADKQENSDETKKTDKENTENKDTKADLKVSKKSIGDIHFSVDGMKSLVKQVKEESISEQAVDAASKNTAAAIGGEKVQAVITGDSEAPEESAEEPKKKGKLGKLIDKAGKAANKVGNKLRDTIKAGASAAKKWFNAQNKWVKILICAIIAVLVLACVYYLFVAVIYPILYSILNGGIINAVAGIFRIYASGKTFMATYKQGKKSWESGEGWGKTFLLIGASILAVINLTGLAAQGSEMMAADQAENTASAAGESANEIKTEKAGVRRRQSV